LAGSHEVILLDQRAHGKSEAPAHGYSLADLAEDAAGLLGALDFTCSAVVGHSIGASVGLTLAATYPHLVTRLVLEELPLHLEPTGGLLGPDPEQARSHLVESLHHLHSRSFQTVLAERQVTKPSWHAAEHTAWVEGKLQFNPRFLAEGGASLIGPWRQQMEHVTCSVLLVRGDLALGSHVDGEKAAEAMRLLQHGTQVHIAGAGHNPHRDRFEEFAAAVEPFLE